ncbi:hypothetical protein D3C81_2042220 [compost metagenome]
MQYGSVVNHFDQEFRTVQELKDLIHHAAYHIEVSPSLETKVKAANIIKALLKKNLSVLEDVV